MQVPSDFVIAPSKTPRQSFEEAWNPLSKLKSLAIPVEPAAQKREGFFSITEYVSLGRKLAPVFSDARLVDGPVQDHAALSLLKGLFEAGRFQGIIFNPRISKSKYDHPFYLLERRSWSRLIGWLELAKKPKDPLPQSRLEFNSGRFHAAHYCLSLLAPEQAGYPHNRLFLARIFIHLNLYRQAYGITQECIRKNPKNGPAKLLMSSICRKTQNIKQARLWLEQAAKQSHEDGVQSDAQDIAALETAWLELESRNYSPADRNFRRVFERGEEASRNEAALGLGIMFEGLGFKDRDKAFLEESASFLKKAAQSENPHRACALFQLGTVFSRLSDWQEAEKCYKKSLALRPAIAAKVNLSLALLMQEKTSESLDSCREIYLLEPESASGIISRLPSKKVLPSQGAEEEQKKEEPLRSQRAVGHQEISGSDSPLRSQRAVGHQEISGSDSPLRSQRASGPESKLPEASFEFVKPPPDVSEAVSPAPSQQSVPEEAKAGKISMQPIAETAWQSSYQAPATDFQSRAWAMADMLREELRKEIRFDAEGLSEMEKKLRHNFVRGMPDPTQALELVLNCASFMCFYLEQRCNGKLHQLPDQDAWSWHMTFENTTIVTFPVERCWRFLRPGAMPEPGWLIQYVEYVEEEIRNANKLQVAGVEAIKRREMSSSHNLTDVETDHRRMMLILPELDETKNIKCNRSGIDKIEKAIKTRFRRGLRPQKDGWRLLRCYGHILVEALTWELNAAWFNTNGNDGLWSMRLPWGTFTFPFGKIYRTALEGGSLTEYYDRLHEEKPKS